MSSIQILSDLHLEAPKGYDTFEITPVAPYLALLGDIGVVEDQDYFLFLENQLSQFQVVFLVPGNHEPYRSDWTKVKHKLRKFEQDVSAKKELGLFVFMDQTRYDISPQVTLLGCTLFSEILLAQMERVSFGLNDFYDIGDWTVEAHNEAFRANLKWINAEVKLISETDPDRKIIILTHYSPTTFLKSVDPAHTESPISSGFSTDLSRELCWTSKNVRIWAFGHTHYNCDFVDESTGKRVLTNQRGYYFKQSDGFNGKMCIDMAALSES